MFPSDEQNLILNTEHKVTIVHAVPGSGKTSVFVEFFLSKIKDLEISKQKVSALSFTNSASKEIQSRSIKQANEHFIGTLDSFLFKYVIKPFGVFFNLPATGVSIIPSPLDEEMRARKIRIGRTAQDDISVFKIKFSGGTIENPEFTYMNNWNLKNVPAEYAANVIQGKMREWQMKGRLTHSDCQYFAAKILTDEHYGAIVLNILSKKFPWILIDEFQDTGHFLYMSVKRILEHQGIRGMIVGDPNQAIFEFSGANPNNFIDLLTIEGSQVMPMITTRRCPQIICNFASEFTNPRITINAAENVGQGRICIVPYDTAEINLTNTLINSLSAEIGNLGEMLVLSRKGKDVRRLSGIIEVGKYEIKSLAPRSINRAIYLFRAERCNEAFKLLSRVMSSLLWEEEVVTLSDRPTLDWFAWKKQIFSLLLELGSIPAGESWNQWVDRAKNATVRIAANYNITKAFGKSFQNDRAGGNGARRLFDITPTATEYLQSFKFKNIHEAKGTEADTVLWGIPKQTQAKCVFNSCFGPNPDYEEMRVAFVAMTRSKRNLIILMHQTSLDRLQELRPNLTEIYQVLNMC